MKEIRECELDGFKEGSHLVCCEWRVFFIGNAFGEFLVEELPFDIAMFQEVLCSVRDKIGYYSGED